MQTWGRRFLPYLLLSVLFHLLVLLAFHFLRVPEPAAELAENPVWIDLQNQKYEIADIEKPAREERPDKSRFLGMYDSHVKEEQVAERQEKGKQTSNAQRQTPKERNQKPEKEAVQDMAEAMPEDFYPDFKRGEHTYLNVLRFPDIQYFVRLKRVFKTTFDPHSPLQAAYVANQISVGSVEAVLGVAVDGKGELAELFIFRGSGLEGYDHEAMRTIRASSPFSAPPSKLLDKDGLLRMTWTFTVYL